MPSESETLRNLSLNGLAAVAEECQRLLNSGYHRNGRWSLGQICYHLRLVQDKTIDGFPWWMSISYPIRPILRWLLLPRLLRGDSPRGLPTAPMFQPPGSVEDETEVAAYVASIDRFLDHTGPFQPHPGFGRLDRETLEAFHVAHAVHHLRFLGEAS